MVIPTRGNLYAPNQQGVLERFETPVAAGRVLGRLSRAGLPFLGADALGALEVANGSLRFGNLDGQEGWGKQALAVHPPARGAGAYFAVWLRSYDGRDTEGLGFGKFATPAPDPYADKQGLAATAGFPAADVTLFQFGKPGGENSSVDGLTRLDRPEFSLRLVESGVAELPPKFYLEAAPGCRLYADRAWGNVCLGRQLQQAPDPGYYALTVRRNNGGPLRVAQLRAGRLARREWWALAHAADELVGAGALGGSAPKKGPAWVVSEGALTRTANGAENGGARAVGWLEPAQKSWTACFVFRVNVLSNFAVFARGDRAANNRWTVSLEPASSVVKLFRVDAGAATEVASAPFTFSAGQTVAVQWHERVEGGFRVVVNDVEAFERGDTDYRDNTGLAFRLDGAQGDVRCLYAEADPYSSPSPLEWAGFRYRGDDAKALVYADTLAGPAGQDLLGRAPQTRPGAETWQRIYQAGGAVLQFDGAGELTSPGAPNDVDYGLAWSYGWPVTLECEIKPPASGDQMRAGVLVANSANNRSRRARLYTDPTSEVEDEDESGVILYCVVGSRLAANDGLWHVLRYWSDGDYAALYLDGDLVQTGRISDFRAGFTGWAPAYVGLYQAYAGPDQTVGSKWRNFKAYRR